jgi:hypothetical protein
LKEYVYSQTRDPRQEEMKEILQLFRNYPGQLIFDRVTAFPVQSNSLADPVRGFAL